MSKQTAVEWLQEKLNKILIDNQIQQIEHLFEQAKQMEKEQIIEAYRKGVEEDVYVNPLKTGIQYYNETFKTQNP